MPRKGYCRLVGLGRDKGFLVLCRDSGFCVTTGFDLGRVEFDKTPRFLYPRVACNAWINFSSRFDENRRLDFHRSYKKTKNLFSPLSLFSSLTLLTVFFFFAQKWLFFPF